MKRWPYITVLLALTALVIHVTGLDEALQWSTGQSSMLTLFASHFTHWNTGHLLWNAGTLLVLGAMVEHHSRRALVAGVVLSSIAIILASQWFSPQAMTYRGLSGIDSGLFVLAAMLMMFKSKDALGIALPSLAIAAFIGKSIYELTTGSLLFVSPQGFAPSPLAHITGASVGLAVSMCTLLRVRFTQLDLWQMWCTARRITSDTLTRRQGHHQQLRSSHLQRV